MKQFYLAQVVTKDKLIHQGLYYRPARVGPRALLWVHGLSGTFYGNFNLLEEFAVASEKSGIGFAAFNGRGSGLISGLKKQNKNNSKGYDHAVGGAGLEDIRESRFDIDAGINFLADQEYKEIILIGHSTGANKVCLWASTQKDPRVIGVVLAAPMSDRLDKVIDQAKMEKNLAYMKTLVGEGRGDELQIGLNYFPITPNRFLSLFSPNSVEDVFDYGDEHPRMEAFVKIDLPLLLVLSENDEYQDRPIIKIKKVFDAHAASVNYQSLILPQALHGYQGKEKEFVQTVASWVAGL